MKKNPQVRGLATLPYPPVPPAVGRSRFSPAGAFALERSVANCPAVEFQLVDAIMCQVDEGRIVG